MAQEQKYYNTELGAFLFGGKEKDIWFYGQLLRALHWTEFEETVEIYVRPN